MQLVTKRTIMEERTVNSMRATRKVKKIKNKEAIRKLKLTEVTN